MQRKNTFQKNNFVLENPQLKALDEHLRGWTSTPLGRREFLASLGLLLTACATVDKNQRLREGDNSGQDIPITPDEERKMTQEVLPQMQKDYPASTNPELQGYIRDLGRKIAQSNGLEGNPYNYQFTVVDVNMVNAFALPAGVVYVTMPLIAMADTEAELAGVVGHEIGHIKARHSAERMAKAKAEQSKSWKYAVGGGLLGAALGYGVGRLACKSEDNDCLSKATQLGAAAGAGGGLLIQKYAFMANSREDEMEADRVGFKTSVQAGYNKDEVGRFYSKLLKMEENHKSNGGQLLKGLTDALSTHPPSRERVQQMEEMAGSTKASPRAVTSTAEFDRVRKICIEAGQKKQLSS